MLHRLGTLGETGDQSRLKRSLLRDFLVGSGVRGAGVVEGEERTPSAACSEGSSKPGDIGARESCGGEEGSEVDIGGNRIMLYMSRDLATGQGQAESVNALQKCCTLSDSEQ